MKSILIIGIITALIIITTFAVNLGKGGNEIIINNKNYQVMEYCKIFKAYKDGSYQECLINNLK